MGTNEWTNIKQRKQKQWTTNNDFIFVGETFSARKMLFGNVNRQFFNGLFVTWKLYAWIEYVFFYWFIKCSVFRVLFKLERLKYGVVNNG